MKRIDVPYPEWEPQEPVAEAAPRMDTAYQRARRRSNRKSWELDPVFLHWRQAGQPERQGEDLSDKTLGIELRRRF